MNFSFLRDFTVVSFLAPCLAHQRFTMLAAHSKGLSSASQFSVVLRFDLVFWYLLNRSSYLRRSRWFMAPTGCLQCGNRWVWEDSRAPYCNTDSVQLADGPDLFPTVKIFGSVHVQSRASVGSQNVHRHVLWVAPVATTSGVRVQQTKKKN